MKRTDTMTRKEMLEYICHLKGMIRTLQTDTRRENANVQTPEPCPILSDEVIAAHRLPIRLEQMAAICAATPKDALCQQRGDWFLVIKGKKNKA
jgi:hypothetical protein